MDREESRSGNWGGRGAGGLASVYRRGYVPFYGFDAAGACRCGGSQRGFGFVFARAGNGFVLGTRANSFRVLPARGAIFVQASERSEVSGCSGQRSIFDGAPGRISDCGRPRSRGGRDTRRRGAGAQREASRAFNLLYGSAGSRRDANVSIVQRDVARMDKEFVSVDGRELAIAGGRAEVFQLVGCNCMGVLL